jgi:hypothetical protein
MKSAFKLFLKIAVPALTVFAYMNCSPTPFESYRTSASRAGFLTKKAPSFIEIMSEFGGNGTNPVTQEQHKITVDTDLADQCGAGDFDIMSSAIDCKVPANLLLTAKDQDGEKVALKFPLNGSLDVNALKAQLLPALSTTVIGPEVHIFLCIDANNNNQCADEAIEDLNKLSGQLVAGLQPILGGDAGIRANAAAIQNNGLCGTFNKGVVFFHKQHKFAAGDQTSNISVSTSDIASNVAGDILKNLDTQTVTTTTNDGTVVTFPIKLATHNPGVCPPPAVRTNGCFAKGTKIGVTKELGVPVENLRAGMPVYLADGRFAKIKRVVAGPEAKAMITFETAAGKITVTSEHPLVTNKGVRLAQDIAIGEELKTAGGKFAAIKSIGTKMYKDLVYNFELDGAVEADHLVVAEGLVSGDLYLQNKLSKEAAEKATQILSAK